MTVNSPGPQATDLGPAPEPGTGLPSGVEVAPLGARFGGWLVDHLIPAVAGVLLTLVLPSLTGGARLAALVGGLVVALGWTVLVWHQTATRAAGPGLRVTGLQLVGFADGRPIGWGRVLLRAVIFAALSLSVVGLLVMLVLLVFHPRKQGWPDLAASAVLIKARTLAPATSDPPAASDPASAGSEPSRPEGRPAPLAAAPPLTAPTPLATPAALAAPVVGEPVAPLTPPYESMPYGASPYSSSPYGSGRPAVAPAGAPPVTPVALPATAVPIVPVPTSGFERPAEPPPPIPPVPQEWVATLDDGREIVVDGLVLLGRNPQPQPGEEDAQLIKLADETRTVSKSHLAMGLRGDRVFVADRGSTNGSTVTSPSGSSLRCRPGEEVLLGAEFIVSMGDHWLRIGHRPR